MNENWSGGHFNDGAWWWAVAFDGIVGAILGGFIAAAVAAVVLRRTLQGEADSARRAAVDLAAAGAYRALVVLNRTPTDPAAQTDAVVACGELVARAKQRDPERAKRLRAEVAALRIALSYLSPSAGSVTVAASTTLTEVETYLDW